MSHDSKLEPQLQAVEPRVRLVPERYLRQVLQYLDDRGRPVPANPSLPCWVDRAELVEEDVLPEAVLSGMDSPLLLVTDPVDRLVSGKPESEQLRSYWGALLQAAVLREIDVRLALGWLTESECQARLMRFGTFAAREIEFVLTSEHSLPSNPDARTIYRIFAAVYLDLAAFDPNRLAVFFPSLPDEERTAGQLFPDLELSVLCSITRPAGAAPPVAEVPPEVRWVKHADASGVVPAVRPQEHEGLPGKAAAARAKGNRIRAAVLLTQAATRAAVGEQEGLLRNAAAELGTVVETLGGLFRWDSATRQEWKEALEPMLALASVGVWPRAARCLYELQTIAADLTREVFAVDLPEYIRTLGRRPVKRPLPHARAVQVLVRLKKAHGQMLRAGLVPANQLRLDGLFQAQMHTTEHEIREKLGPIIEAKFSEGGLAPENTVERVGRDKAVAELLDRVCERGYLRLGDLRDAIARNRLKLPDLAGPGEFARGNALLRIDSAMPYALDGVYQRGEFYLRLIQRGSAFFFGTLLGRLITVYLAIPFGGAFLALMFAEELRHLGGSLAAAVTRTASKPAPAVPPPATTQPAAPMGQLHGPDVVHSDQVDLDDSGQVVWDPRQVSSDDIEYDDNGDLLWLDSPAGSSLARQVFTSSSNTAPAKPPPEASVLIAWPTILGFGMFLLLMIHVPPFRRTVFRLVRGLWLAIRGVLWDLPRGVWQSSTVKSVRQSLPVRFAARHFWSPLLLSVLLFVFLFVVGVSPWFLLRWGVWIWAGMTVAYNTPWGWVIQDRIAEAISDWWRVVRTNLIPGLIATLIDWFRRLANWVERMLYAVDEWLRFRGGDSQGSFVTKAILGLIWFPIAYTFRFVFFLLVEPQINPVKHFPVVTVSHKVIWPMVPEIAAALNTSPWSVAMFVNGIPGIFGFIAWELKENWRLYKANLPPRLKPVMIGSHGETMRGLMRPGFHSGTVPKLYRKCRRAAPKRVAWLLHDREHLAEAVEHFVTREFIDLLRSAGWSAAIQVEEVAFGAQRVAIALAAPGLGTDPFIIAFENVGGDIEATIEQAGWEDKLTGEQQQAFVAAARGLLDMAAAATVNGRPRTDDPAARGPGFDDLCRTVSWEEWVDLWGKK